MGGVINNGYESRVSSLGLSWNLQSSYRHIQCRGCRNSMAYQLGISAIALCWLFLSGCSSRTATPPPRPVNQSEGFYHIVKAGENLFRIGKAYDVRFEELARLNGIRDPSQIRVGQRIFVPGATRQVPVETITPVEIPLAVRQTAPTQETPADGRIWPVIGAINSPFGSRGQGFHDGVDIAAPEGTPIHAIEGGEVVYSDQLRGYGNIVIIRHGAGMMSVYAHNQVNLVREGQPVERGEVIAKVGSTGRVTGPHLHFEIRKDNVAQDPLHYLPQLCCLAASATVPPEGQEDLR